MGTAQSKFHDLLLQGKVEDAHLLWIESEELQTRLQPNASVRGSRWRDPPLHCLLRHGDYKQSQLKALALELVQNGANPIQQNRNGETALHIVCTSQRHSKRVSQARREILELLLQWLPDQVVEGKKEKQLEAEEEEKSSVPAWLEIRDAVS